MNNVVNPSKRILIVCVKAPVIGEIKSRLLPTFSSQEAADLYKCFVLDTFINVAKEKSIPLVVAYQPHPKYPNLDWLKLKNSPPFFKQDGSNLRDRLIHAFGCHFGKGYQQIVVTGSDSPAISSDYIAQAFKTLNESDVVLGPTPVGGYCLVGLSRPCLKLFDDVVWSSDQVYERTAQNAYAQNYRLKVLSQHFCVETIDDLKMLYTDLEKHPEKAPATSQFLQRLCKVKALFSVA